MSVGTLSYASRIFWFILKPRGSPAGHSRRGRDGLGVRGTVREVVEVEALMPMRRRRLGHAVAAEALAGAVREPDSGANSGERESDHRS